MDFFDYILVFFVPVIIMISGVMMWLKTPNQHSKLGWHSKAFTKDTETFKLANQYGGRAITLLGIIEFILTLLVLVFIGYNSVLSLIFIVVQFLGYFAAINHIEKILIKKFQD